MNMYKVKKMYKMSVRIKQYFIKNVFLFKKMNMYKAKEIIICVFKNQSSTLYN